MTYVQYIFVINSIKWCSYANPSQHLFHSSDIMNPTKLKLKKTNILSLFLISKKTETKKSLDQRGVGLIDCKAWKTYRIYISWQTEPCHKYERLCLPAFRNEKCITCMKNNLLRVLPGMLCSWINWKIRIF